MIVSSASVLAASRDDSSIERADFASFIDGYIAGIQRDWNIPGMVFIAVSDGQVLYKRGYGRASSSASEEISPEKTLFRIGEISRVFTATAILQLAEKGRVSLDEDVNSYLRRNRLHDGFAETPVTLRHLLTHTAGFEDKQLEIGVQSAAEERGFANRLQRVMPSRYAPPGIFYGRSNIGYAILGSIVERYSRQNFASAIKRHIFSPLDMKSSTFCPTEHELERTATGYDQNGRMVEHEYHIDLPAVSMCATADDMGRFMRAALGGGVIGRGRILSQAYADTMLRTHYSPDPKIDGAALGYMERHVLGVRTLQAYGNIRGCSSFMMLIPEKRFGIFFASNVSGLDLSGDISQAIIARFFGGSPEKIPTAISSAPIPSDIAGSYRTNRISRSTAEKVLQMFCDQIDVDIDDGSVIISHRAGAHSSEHRYVPVGTDPHDGSARLFAAADGDVGEDERYIFFQQINGSTVAMIIGNVGNTYDKLDLIDKQETQMILRMIFVSTAAISVIGLFFSYAVNKDKLPWEKGMRSAVEMWTISSIFCAIQIAFIFGIVAAYRMIGESFTTFVPYQVKALFVIPLAGGLLLAWFWFRLIVGHLFSTNHHWAEKIILSAIGAIEVMYMCFLFHWRLLGFMF